MLRYLAIPYNGFQWEVISPTVPEPGTLWMMLMAIATHCGRESGERGLPRRLRQRLLRNRTANPPIAIFEGMD